MAKSKRAQARKLSSLSSDFFLLGQQIASGQAELPSCEALRRRVLNLFETFSTRSQRAGLLQSDIQAASFALAAYIDEMIQYSTWPGRQEWSTRPLQAILFSEATAGTRFYERLDEVRRTAPVALEVFYLCMALGFMGQYRMAEQSRHGELVSDLRRQLEAERERYHPTADGLTIAA